MSTNVRTILQVNARDIGGGAERVAAGLSERYQSRGLNAYLAVGHASGEDPDVLLVSTGEGHPKWYRSWRRIADKFGGPVRALDEFRGIESFHYPATYRLPDLPPQNPDIIHAHNLHGGFFDLRALPWLSRQYPLVLTLHDAWLLSGHCSHSFDCERWRSGCGSCPDLSIYPEIRRDETAYNWQRKREIYAESRLFVATPCNWLMQRVEQSMLAPAIVASKVIPNGVDTTIFKPSDKYAARKSLHIEPDARVLLFVASRMRENSFKDYETIHAAVRSLVAGADGSRVLLLALGDAEESMQVDTLPARSISFESDPATVARYYQAADLYLHAARADSFPLAILEALACGIPVIATAVGGIPEQVKSLRADDQAGRWRGHAELDATGVLVGPGDSASMADAVNMLLDNDDLRNQIARNAAINARSSFDIEHQCDSYLNWYEEILCPSGA